MIKENLLIQYGAKIVEFSKGDYLFEKGSSPKYYYQIINGGVKMNYYNQSGNEFIQGIFGKNRSFGEPPLLIDTKYPANAIALNSLSVYLLKKEAFETLLLDNNEVHYAFTKMISKRLYFKATIANGISSNSAEEAILTLLNYLKNDVHQHSLPFNLKIDFTRKNIAGLLGLSIESTIRTIKKMEAKKTVKIINQKIYY
ncbi:cyclic nucleotide-binding domain-containing protein [Tenacibaculum finnmarkense genomovar ulcerans]|uniref:Crp/Fnr family transcriptional regulator n=1 Tax=Tenacibaculum finnmarkense TaxID=2781243 RepID=UPI00187B3F97|nr:Crp/Fnr family transcriptional regulator [Tenacibaculum finnmarkense]MBE7644475.1 cyclic nucleotide-binding domain-containing protein [Tenacibaculum finnmarkense genomovar ulcerans]MCD8399683.1 Crp/Fnr family transcriptional regulator [Tenacibaculum finnmarkense genomovar ulcerans]WCC41766.1 Crp/Fnr family transcriptional regulator [Tenacibaculum finnmarkense]